MINQLIWSIGVLALTVLFLQLFKFIILYLRPSQLLKYKTGGAYALITGATDGIGKAIALELANNGFNVIIHGRNVEKLKLAENEIITKNPTCNVINLAHDGSKSSKMDISSISHLPITILVNNVGVGPISEFTEMSNQEIDETIMLNTAFPSQLTHDLIPFFKKPALILNVSSYAGLLPPPYLAVYAGTKAYNNAFSISLARELENIEVISLLTGSVNTGSNRKPVSFMRPSAETYAKCVLNRIGCGRQSIMPYWQHAIQTFLISLLPQKFIDKATKNALRKELTTKRNS
jgi:17beta-estradiol 17-dehydrogenase / very-long-chain 3-oxoacyl-CoA reductase